MPGKDGPYNNKKLFAVVVLLLFIMIAIVLFILLVLRSPSEKSTEEIDLEKPYTLDFENLELVMTASSDRVRHIVMADITIELERGSEDKITRRTLQDKIIRICGTLDYDKVTSKENLRYLETELKNEVKEVWPDEFIALYVSKLIGDDIEIYNDGKLIIPNQVYNDGELVIPNPNQ